MTEDKRLKEIRNFEKRYAGLYEMSQEKAIEYRKESFLISEIDRLKEERRTAETGLFEAHKQQLMARINKIKELEAENKELKDALEKPKQNLWLKLRNSEAKWLGTDIIKCQLEAKLKQVENMIVAGQITAEKLDDIGYARAFSELLKLIRDKGGKE